MVTTKLNLSMTEPQVRQIYAKQGDTGRVLDISLDQTPEDGTLRILRPDGVEVTSEAVTGGEVESGSSFESLTEADVTELTVGIEPVQDLSHGDPSPTNICPITGHDEVRVTRTGINVWNDTSESGYIDVNTGDPRASDAQSRSLFVEVKPSTQYCYVNEHASSGVRIAFYDNEKIFCGNFANGNANPQTFTTPANAHYLRFYWGDISKVSINYPSTDHDYHAYQGSTYTTSLGQTVYGGTLDMVSGVLTVDRAMRTFSGDSTDGWLAYSAFNGYYTLISDMAVGTRQDGISNMLVDSKSSAQGQVGAMWLGVNNRYLYAIGVMDVMGSTVSDFNQYLANNPLQVVYPLTTPVTYQLTAQQIKTLVGTNNVWASSGDIVNIKFTYGGLLSELPSDATSVVGKCYCDVEQNGVSSMPFTLNVKKNERES